MTGRGGNVFLDVVSGGRNVCCAVYRETGIATTAGELIAGDGIQVGGGIRRAAPGRPRTLNVEFIRVLRLARCTVWTNPACPQCKKRMKSRGQNQGYRCQVCKMRSPARGVPAGATGHPAGPLHPGRGRPQAPDKAEAEAGPDQQRRV